MSTVTEVKRKTVYDNRYRHITTENKKLNIKNSSKCDSCSLLSHKSLTITFQNQLL